MPLSPVGDFITSFPADFPKDGQINAYEVTTDLPEGTPLHFDAFGFYVKRNPGHEHHVFAPFSHDAGTDAGTRIPNPASLVLLASALLYAAVRRRLRPTDSAQ